MIAAICARKSTDQRDRALHGAHAQPSESRQGPRRAGDGAYRRRMYRALHWNA
jgi:hypothetical protein